MLRKSFLAKRNLLTPKEVEQGSDSILERLISEINIDNVSCVHCFLPISKNKEVNITPFIEVLHSRGIRVVVPVSNFVTHEMEAALYPPGTRLTVNNGISEPLEPNFVSPDSIDVIILPLTIFDKKGYRIGYGGGFYDRFIDKLESKPKLVGVSFFDAIDDIYPNDFDAPLDCCLTPSKTYFF